MKWLAALALLLVAAVAGYAFRGNRNAQAIATAQSNEAVCRSALESNGASLADVKKTLADVRKRHDEAKAAAEKVLAARDEEIAALTKAAKDKADSIRKTAYDDADCASLARLPVCSVVARQLWPGTAEAHADDHAH